MAARSGNVGLAVLVYFAGLLFVTPIAVIVFGTYPDLIVVPIEYLLPLIPAILVYRFRTKGHY